MGNDIKINVKADADLGSVSSAMDVLNKKAAELQSTLGKPVSIAVENDDAINKIKEVGRADEEAKRRVTGAPSSTTSDTPEEIVNKRKQRQLRELNEEYKKHFSTKRELNELDLKAYSAATNRMSNSGSAFSAYAEAAAGDPKKLAELSPAAFKHALERTGVANSNSKAGAGLPKGFGGRLGSAAAGMAGGMMSGGAGGDGMATAGSALGGMVGSFAGPAGSVIGGAIGGLVGGVVGGGMSDAKDEAIGITDLRHSLGATTVDFNALRESTRAAASGMGITFQESVKLAKSFAHNANTQAGGAGSLANEIRLASSLSRSLGLDPSQGVDAMGTLRNTRATSDEAGSRKMAMIIAEGITKGGMSSKSDEVLSAIANFATTNARASLQAPNVGGYTDFLANLVSMKTPGLDVAGSASLMAKADSGIRSHGDMATDTFKLGAYTTAYGKEFSAADQQLYSSGGAMGTGRKTAQGILDDPNSSPERKKSAQAVLQSNNADRVNQDIMMQQLGRFKRGSSEYELSGARVFGMEQSEFRKFDKAYYNNNSKSGMKGTLSGMGVNVDKLDPEKYMHMGALLGSNKDELKTEAEKLIGGKGYDKSLTDKEKETLRGTMKNGSEDDLRQAVIKLNENRQQIDDGAAVRQNTADMKNEITKLASELLPAVEKLRETLLFVFGKDKDQFAAQQKKWALAPQEMEIHNKANAEVARLKAEHDASKISENERMKQAAGVRLKEAADIEKIGSDYDAQQVAKKPKVEGSTDTPEEVNPSVKKGFELINSGNPADYKEGQKLIAQGRKEEAERRAAQQAQAVSSSAPLAKTQEQMMASLTPKFRGDFDPALKKWNSAHPNQQIELESGARTKEEQEAIRADYKRRGINIPVAGHSDHLSGNAVDVRSRRGNKDDVAAFNKFAVGEGFVGNIPNDPMHIGAKRGGEVAPLSGAGVIHTVIVKMINEKGRELAKPVAVRFDPAKAGGGFNVSDGAAGMFS